MIAKPPGPSNGWDEAGGQQARALLVAVARLRVCVNGAKLWNIANGEYVLRGWGKTWAAAAPPALRLASGKLAALFGSGRLLGSAAAGVAAWPPRGEAAATATAVAAFAPPGADCVAGAAGAATEGPLRAGAAASEGGSGAGRASRYGKSGLRPA